MNCAKEKGRSIPDGTRVRHKHFGDGTVQPLFKNLHPNFPEDLVYVKFDVWPVSPVSGARFGVDIVQVETDELEDIK